MLDHINREFKVMIMQRGIYRKLCNAEDPVALNKMYGKVRSIRRRLAANKVVTIDMKIKLLLRSGWRPPTAMYSRTELVNFLSKAIKLNKQTRSMGGAFVLEQLERSQK